MLPVVQPPPAVSPCTICRTTGGRVSPKNGRVERWSLERFGRTGAGCYTCYHDLYRLTGGSRRGVVVAPPLLEPDDPPIEPEELDERTARVRAAKRAKHARMLPPYLTTRELNRILPWELAP